MLPTVLDHELVTLHPCTDSFVFSIEDALCCAALIAQDCVVHLQDHVLGVVVLHVFAAPYLPPLVVGAFGQMESNFSFHGSL